MSAAGQSDAELRQEIQTLRARVAELEAIRAQREQAEEQRQELEAQLRHAQKMQAIGQLAGGIAHDFNNVLTAIFGYTSLARDTLPSNHEALKSLDQVNAAAEQGAGITRVLMTFSRRSPTTKAPTNLNGVVQNAMHLLRRLLPATIEIRTQTSPEPLLVDADASQLQQVIINIAINARDAMPNGGQLEITVRPDSRAGTQTGKPAGRCWTELEIRDTGVGMPSDVRQRAFEPFFTTKEEGQSVGLGLSIVHGIIQEHSGTIDVTSTPGKGTTFKIRLPSLMDVPVAHGPTRLEETPHGVGELIVLAEDDEHVRRILVSVLRRLGYAVLQVSDGKALMEICARERERVDLLVVDLEMPRQDGLSCLRALRADGLEMPALLITARVDADLEDKLDERTMLLQKPFPIETLGTLVDRLLKQRAHRAMEQ